MGWLSTLPTVAAKAAMALIELLDWTLKTSQQTGPAEALNWLKSRLPEHNLRLLGEFRPQVTQEVERVKAGLISQQQMLESVLNNLRATQQESDPNLASNRIGEVLNYVKGNLASTHVTYKRDLQTLEQMWIEAMGRAMPDLGRPISNTRVLQLVRELDSIKAVSTSTSTGRASITGEGVREEVLLYIYKPLAAALRHITQVSVTANIPINNAVPMGSGSGATPGNVPPGLIPAGGQTSGKPVFDLNSPLFFAGLLIAAIGLSIIAVAFLMKGNFPLEVDVFLRVGTGGLLLGLALVGGLFVAQAYQNKSAGKTIPLAVGGGMMVVAIVSGVFMFSSILGSGLPKTPEEVARATATAKALAEAIPTHGQVIDGTDVPTTRTAEAVANATSTAQAISTSLAISSAKTAIAAVTETQVAAEATAFVHRVRRMEGPEITVPVSTFWVSPVIPQTDGFEPINVELTIQVISGVLDYAGFSFWRVTDGGNTGTFFVEQAIPKYRLQLISGRTYTDFVTNPVEKANSIALENETKPSADPDDQNQIHKEYEFTGGLAYKYQNA